MKDLAIETKNIPKLLVKKLNQNERKIESLYLRLTNFWWAKAKTGQFIKKFIKIIVNFENLLKMKHIRDRVIGTIIEPILKQNSIKAYSE